MATALLLGSMATPLSQAEEANLNELASDLRYLLCEYDVHDRVQLRFHQLRYRSLKTFTVFADDRAGVRNAFTADVADINEAGLTADQQATVRVMSAQVLSAWVNASTKDVEEVRAAAENKVMRLPNLISRTGLIEFRKRFEREHGRQVDSIWPCASLIERRLEECEEGAFSAPPLSEVISVEAAGEEATEITEVGLNLRVRRSPKAISLPVTTEQLRNRMRTLAISYVVASYKHQSRLWLRTATMTLFASYVEYLLGDTVANFHLDQDGISVQASWTTVLGYELNIRKLVTRLVLYDGLDFETALVRAMADLACKSQYFLTPTALLTAARGGRGSGPTAGTNLQVHDANKPLSARAKKKARAKAKIPVKTVAKAKGASLAKAKGKGKGKMQKTPDGRLICGFVNLPQGCVKTECTYLHVCSLCYDPDHVASECPMAK